MPAASTSTTTAALLSSIALLCAACGSSEPEAAAPSSSSAPSSAAAGGGGAGTALQAIVGTEAEPDAFEIDLLDAAGASVRTLPAGTYTITVDDLSKIHNFALSGPGGVAEKTSVPETGEFVFEVDLVAGDYAYVCDPHPRMSGSFTVT